MNKTPWFIAALLTLGLALGSRPASAADSAADSVTLKDGRVLQGEVIEEGKDTVVVLVDGIKRSYGRNFIAKIAYGSGAAGAAPEAGPVGPGDSGAGPQGDPSMAVPGGPPSGSLVSDIAVRYRVPVSDVLWVRQQGVPDADLPLVFLVAATARVVPRAVVKLRLRGWSWADIEEHFGMRSRYIYYAPGPWGAYPYYYYPGVYAGWGWGWGGRWGGRWGWGHRWR
jgi:hypothetical protein